MSKLFFLLCIFTVLPISAQGVDPTKPLQGYSLTDNNFIGEKKLVLEAIIHGDSVHTVVINKKTLKVGDSINEHRLVAVNDDSVVLRTDTETIKLYIFTGVIAK